MAEAYPQFTPAQILDAGERAAQDGRKDYATQFFQHLIDHYGQTPEAEQAREAIARLSAPKLALQLPAQLNGGGHAPAQQYGSAGGDLQGLSRLQRSPAAPNGHSQAHVNGALPADLIRNGDRGAPSQGTNGQALAAPSPPPAPAPSQTGHAYPAAPDQAGASPRITQPQAFSVPEAESHYGVSRALAWIVSALGMLAAIGGAILVVGAFGGFQVLEIFGVRTAPGAAVMGPILLGGGIAVFFVGQMARAVFDSANAMRDMAMVTRVRAEFEEENSGA